MSEVVGTFVFTVLMIATIGGLSIWSHIAEEKERKRKRAFFKSNGGIQR